MPIDTRLQPWYDRKMWHQSDGVSRDLQAGMQMGQRNREFAAAQELRASVLRSQEAYRQTQINTMLMRQKQMEAEQTDAALVTEWMKDPRQPPPSGLRTPKGLQAVTQVQKAFAETEIGSKFAAVRKAYTDKIKDLDAVAALKVQQLLNVNQGEITPEIAAIIDAETARMKRASAGLQVIDQLGQPFVEGGEAKPAFIRSMDSPALHRLPQDWDGQAEPITDVEGNVIGYGIRTGSGVRVLPQQKLDEPTLSPSQRGTMNAEFSVVKQWWDDLDIKERRKPEMQAEMKRRLKDVENRFSTTKRVRVKSPSGKIGSIPESQLQDALKQGYTPAE